MVLLYVVMESGVMIRGCICGVWISPVGGVECFMVN